MAPWMRSQPGRRNAGRTSTWQPAIAPPAADAVPPVDDAAILEEELRRHGSRFGRHDNDPRQTHHMGGHDPQGVQMRQEHPQAQLPFWMQGRRLIGDGPGNLVSLPNTRPGGMGPMETGLLGSFGQRRAAPSPAPMMQAPAPAPAGVPAAAGAPTPAPTSSFPGVFSVLNGVPQSTWDGVKANGAMPGGGK